MLALALGTALVTSSNLGLSMVVAPSYLLHLKISEFLPFFTFGVASYAFQAILLLGMIAVIRKFKLSYLLSFASAVIQGYLLDGFLVLLGMLPLDLFWVRLLLFVSGIIVTAFGVALLFKPHFPPAPYEMFVKEISKCFRCDINKFKIIFDFSCLSLAIIFSFVFYGFGTFVGVNLGTIIIVCLNGITISMFSKLIDKKFEIKDKFDLKIFFEGK